MFGPKVDLQNAKSYRTSSQFDSLHALQIKAPENDDRVYCKEDVRGYTPD
jgi:hypothetical protein